MFPLETWLYKSPSNSRARVHRPTPKTVDGFFVHIFCTCGCPQDRLWTNVDELSTCGQILSSCGLNNVPVDNQKIIKTVANFKFSSGASPLDPANASFRGRHPQTPRIDNTFSSTAKLWVWCARPQVHPL